MTRNVLDIAPRGFECDLVFVGAEDSEMLLAGGVKGHLMDAGGFVQPNLADGGGPPHSKTLPQMTSSLHWRARVLDCARPLALFLRVTKSLSQKPAERIFRDVVFIENHWVASMMAA